MQDQSPVPRQGTQRAPLQAGALFSSECFRLDSECFRLDKSRMASLTQITIAPHLTFDALTAGDDAAPLVLLLHGFAESMHCWHAQVAALADMGYRAVAPSQRGYSAGARPDPHDF